MDYLRSEWGVIRQVQFHLCILCIYNPMKRSYERKYRQSDEQLARRPPPSRRRGAARRESSSDDSDASDQDEDQEEAHWPPAGNQPAAAAATAAAAPADDWTYPSYPRIFWAYNLVCDLLLAWVMLKFLVPGAFEGLGRHYYAWFIGGDWAQASALRPECLVFGRFFLHYEQPIEVFGFEFVCFHVGWRLGQLALERSHPLDLVLFVMQPRDRIERFIKKLHGGGGGGVVGGGGGQQSCTTTFYRSLSQYERFLAGVMCFRVTYGRDYCSALERPRVLYRLRPNRTLQAHGRLVQRLADMTIRALYIMSALTIIFTLYIACSILFNQWRYLNVYPGCDPHLERLRSEGRLERWSVAQFGRRHFVATLLFDGLENGVIWVHSGLVFVSCLLFALYLNADLLAQWHSLRHRLQALLADSGGSGGAGGVPQPSLPRRGSLMVAGGPHRHSHSHSHSHGLPPVADQLVYEFQAELCDFFHQITRVDEFTSDVITYGLCLWLVCYGSASYQSVNLYLSTGDANFGMVIVMFASLVLFTLTLVSVSLLTLQRRCHCSYTAICSLVAHYQSRHKGQLTRIGDFYTMQNRTCYTLFRMFPFSSSAFLSIMGWYVSCILVLDTVMRRR